jgi:hypothetical protein
LRSYNGYYAAILAIEKYRIFKVFFLLLFAFVRILYVVVTPQAALCIAKEVISTQNKIP